MRSSLFTFIVRSGGGCGGMTFSFIQMPIFWVSNYVGNPSETFHLTIPIV